MNSAIRFLKNYTLPLAMLTGIVAYPVVSYLSWVTPYLIFGMLFLTFCKLSPRAIRFRPAHIYLLIIQLLGSICVYFLLRSCHQAVAHGAMICLLVPTATAAAVVTGMLGGSVAFITSYILLCNIAVAFAAPAIFPWIGMQSEMPFIDSFLYICRQMVPLLLCPLLLAWTIRYFFPSAGKRLARMHGFSFYCWAFALTVVTGKTVKFLIEQENPDYAVETSLAVVSLLACCGQFLIGRRIGKHYGDAVSCGQALGQKNTILAIWMAQSYLNPISSIAPAMYVLWQNIINSWQLWKRKN